MVGSVVPSLGKREKRSISLTKSLITLLEDELKSDERYSSLSRLLEYYARLGYNQVHGKRLSIDVSGNEPRS